MYVQHSAEVHVYLYALNALSILKACRRPLHILASSYHALIMLTVMPKHHGQL